MLKQSIMWASICATAPVVCAQETNINDSIELSISPQLLEEVVIKASPVIQKTDGKVIRPTQETLRASADGIDLLRKLQIAGITVNPMTNSVDITGGGKVLLCLNGVESTAARIAAISPQDIQRIEYIDNPGTRYPDADAVIDYITSRHDSGGNIFLNSFGAFEKGRWASIDNLSAQYNRGRSVWTADAAYFGKRSTNWMRDYEEEWHYPDGTLTRHESGLPVTVGNNDLETSVNYNYIHPAGNMLNVRFGFNLDDVPNKEEGDRHAILETSDSETPVTIREHTEEHAVQPNMGIYYQHHLSDTRNLILDLQGSYIHSRMKHDYSENDFTESSRVNGKRYAMKFLAMYENRFGSRIWNIGLANNTSFINNTYFHEESVKVDIRQSETAVMGEYSNRFGQWGMTGQLKGVYRHLGQEERNLDRVFLVPALHVSFRPADKWYIRYSASLDYKMPSAAEISDVDQPIQAGMIRRGNASLKPFRVIDQSLDITFESPFFSLIPRLKYRNEHKPIMESVIYEQGQFIRTYFNQRSFQRLMAGGTIGIRPWQDHLSISAEPMLTRYFSHGLDYRHCHNIFRVGVNVDFTYGNWLAYGNIMSGPMNYMYGEEIIEEKDMNQIMIGYKRDKWSVHAGVFDAFINYWMESRNLSALTPYKSKAHSGKHSMYFALKFNLMLDFGRKGREVEVHENTIDNDSGILTGTK